MISAALTGCGALLLVVYVYRLAHISPQTHQLSIVLSHVCGGVCACYLLGSGDQGEPIFRAAIMAACVLHLAHTGPREIQQAETSPAPLGAPETRQ